MVEKFVHAVKDAIVQLVLEDQKMLEDQEVDQVQEAEIDAQEADNAVEGVIAMDWGKKTAPVHRNYAELPEGEGGCKCA